MNSGLLPIKHTFCDHIFDTFMHRMCILWKFFLLNLFIIEWRRLLFVPILSLLNLCQIPAMAVEMPGSTDISGLNLQFGALQFGSEPVLPEYDSTPTTTTPANQVQNSLYTSPGRLVYRYISAVVFKHWRSIKSPFWTRRSCMTNITHPKENP